MDYEKFLEEKYKKATLTTKELSVELSDSEGNGVSERMIADRVRACSSELPPFKQIGRKVVFPIKEVAKFLESGLVKVA